MRRRAIVLVSLVALVGCSSTSEAETRRETLEAFRLQLEAGMPCFGLFEIRNELDPKDPVIEQMNEMLREIGCYLDTSERTDT